MASDAVKKVEEAMLQGPLPEEDLESAPGSRIVGKEGFVLVVYQGYGEGGEVYQRRCRGCWRIRTATIVHLGRSVVNGHLQTLVFIGTMTECKVRMVLCYHALFLRVR